MINTSSKTLGVQEKTQDIKQSPSTKIGTKPYARSRRNELAEATGRWTERWEKRPDAGPDTPMKRLSKLASAAATGRWRQNRPDAGQQRLIEYREVSERRNWDRTRPVAGDRTLAESDQCSRLQRSGRPDASSQDVISVRSVAEKWDFIPNGYFLSGAYK